MIVTVSVCILVLSSKAFRWVLLLISSQGSWRPHAPPSAGLIGCLAHVLGSCKPSHPDKDQDAPDAFHHPPSAICHLPSAIRHPPSAIRHPPSTIHHSPFVIHPPPSTLHHLPSIIYHLPSTIHHPDPSQTTFSKGIRSLLVLPVAWRRRPVFVRTLGQVQSTPPTLNTTSLVVGLRVRFKVF
ncbi:hypothetical protein GQ43DRAFT_88937 [Delitschia confertaspora ATCC 74209]|uniref:Uncharacterized protein n=1 Tax=Delitschia confertaspora ATCC 74209 TaxID=1513339 RepID=A0A9P4JNL7_9PLEO|nr:hypothetical protein GQ43DRAFT_88937 [Delitschia confertaspora ATCC 74209]